MHYFHRTREEKAVDSSLQISDDLIDGARVKPESFKRNPKEKKKNQDISERFGSYYLRFTTIDKPGVISGISQEFKKNKISMKSMLQKDNKPEKSKNATIVVTTHNCLERNMKKALKKINKLNFVLKNTVVIRIESLK